jgi:hypothetical protein
MSQDIVSKVLVLENDPEALQIIKRFCEESGLVGLTADKRHLNKVLGAAIDLGAILFAEDFAGTTEESTQLARTIHALRPELPIILRRETEATLSDLGPDVQGIFSAAYISSDMAGLRKVTDEFLFNMSYPNAFLRGISEITQSVLKSQLKAQDLLVDTPYVVRDRLMFGEIYSLIPLESVWCRGYMVLQTEEAPLLATLGSYGDAENEAGFRQANSLLGEVTNLIWGSFKNRFIGDAASVSGSTIQVPIVVNQKRGHMSFGTENPELCFRYRFKVDRFEDPVVVYQRLAFNLHWAPEGFKEIEQEVGDLVDSGELEMF